MGAFATQFEVALKEAKLRQVDVTKKVSGISQGMVSRYRNGNALPEPANLEILAQIFPEHIREKLVTGYLIDHIPPSAAHLVSVGPVRALEAQQPLLTYGKAVEGSELSQCLGFLEERSLQNPQVAEAVIAIVRVLRSERPTLPLNTTVVEPAQPDLGLMRDMPLFGFVPAGFPSDNPQQPEDFVQVPIGKYPEDSFALRVHGDSMIGRDINDGDIVVVHKREPKSGDIVVALTDAGTTLKTLTRHKGKWKLRSENPRYKDPIFSDQSIIQAVVIEKLHQRSLPSGN